MAMECCSPRQVDRKVLERLRNLDRSVCCIPKECSFFPDRVLYIMTDRRGNRRWNVWVFADEFEYRNKRYPTVDELIKAIHSDS